MAQTFFFEPFGQRSRLVTVHFKTLLDGFFIVVGASLFDGTVQQNAPSTSLRPPPTLSSCPCRPCGRPASSSSLGLRDVRGKPSNITPWPFVCASYVLAKMSIISSSGISWPLSIYPLAILPSSVPFLISPRNTSPVEMCPCRILPQSRHCKCLA